MSTAVFGAPGFRARSGRTVTTRSDGSVLFDHANGYLSPASVMDAEEFFQAKRDAELGRWRWPENPEWIVYPSGAGRSPYGRADLFIVNERHGSAMEYIATDDDGTEYVGPDEPAARAARAYLEAHPERKPWEDARPGEIWEITRDGIGEGVYFRATHEWRAIWPFSGSAPPASSLNRVTSARRVWPEDAS